MVRKSEKHIEDALKKAEEEENKIFSLFLDVMKEKNIEINLDDEEEDQKGVEGEIKDLRKSQKLLKQKGVDNGVIIEQ